MTTYADVRVGDENIRVEIDPYVAEGEVQVSLEQVSKRLESSFEDAMLVIKTAGERIIKTMNSLSHVPSEASVEFGLKIDAEAGALIARALTGAQFKITLVWKQTEPQATKEKDDAKS